MTILTCQSSVRAGQSKTRRIVIEVRRLPCIHVMASRAVVIKIAGRVIRLVCVSKGGAMTTEAVICRVRVRTAVAILALNLGVCTFKRKARHVVIESCRRPNIHRMTSCAVLRKICGFVIWIWRFKVIGVVARVTIGRRSGKLGCMTRGAVKTLMPAFKDRRRGMVESRALPRDRRGAMTLYAVAVESCQHMVGICCAIEVALVTRLAVSRSAGILLA